MKWMGFQSKRGRWPVSQLESTQSTGQSLWLTASNRILITIWPSRGGRNHWRYWRIKCLAASTCGPTCLCFMTRSGRSNPTSTMNQIKIIPSEKRHPSTTFWETRSIWIRGARPRSEGRQAYRKKLERRWSGHLKQRHTENGKNKKRLTMWLAIR